MSAPIRWWCCPISPSSSISSPRVKFVPGTADNVAIRRDRAGAGARTSPRSCRRVCCRGCGRCCSRASPEVQDRERGRRLAAEMVLVRIAYVADLPTPDEVHSGSIETEWRSARAQRDVRFRRIIAVTRAQSASARMETAMPSASQCVFTAGRPGRCLKLAARSGNRWQLSRSPTSAPVQLRITSFPQSDRARRREARYA